MSRIQQAMTRALKATAADLTEIVKIGGLSNQDRYILRRASEICTGLMDKPMASRLANEKQSQNATNGRSAEPSNDKPSAGPHNQEAGNAGQGGAANPSPFPNHGKPWQPNEVGILQNAITVATSLGRNEIDVQTISRKLGRTPYSVASKAVTMGFRNGEWAISFRLLPKGQELSS